MMNREDVIKGLECIVSSGNAGMRDDCANCVYPGGGDCLAPALQDALALLKAQEPRVMTLINLRDIGSVWELDTPPYLWMEIDPSYRWTRGFWVAWREIFDMIDGLHPTYDADNYGKIWRCWTSRPTDEQREEIPWRTT